MRLIIFFLLLAQLAYSQSAQDTIPVKSQKNKIPPFNSVTYHQWEMPHFPGCEEIQNYNERKKCADEKMISFIYSNLKYPNTGVDIEGTCVVQVIIGKDGKLRDHKLVRDIGGGAGEEALRIVKMLPDFIPIKHKITGDIIEITYNIPVKFKLN